MSKVSKVLLSMFIACALLVSVAGPAMASTTSTMSAEWGNDGRLE